MGGQTERLYKAENALLKILDNATKPGAATIVVANSTVVIPTEVKFGSLDAVQKYCDAVCEDYCVGTVKVRARRGNRKAEYTEGTIAIFVGDNKTQHWALREAVVLHELAHHLSRGDGHGPRFAKTLLNLVEKYLGPGAWLILIDAFASGGVAF